jgi:hypothetical protein
MSSLKCSLACEIYLLPVALSEIPLQHFLAGIIGQAALQRLLSETFGPLGTLISLPLRAATMRLELVGLAAGAIPAPNY